MANLTADTMKNSGRWKMSFKGWFGERYRHSLAARGISLATRAPVITSSEFGHPNRWSRVKYPLISKNASPFIVDQVVYPGDERLKAELENQERFLEAGGIGSMITNEPGAPGYSVVQESYLEQVPSTYVEPQEYPVYGTFDKPNIPYWYGPSKKMTPAESIAEFKILRKQLADKIYNDKLNLDQNRYILSSNKFSPARKEAIREKLYAEASVEADDFMSSSLGLPSLGWGDMEEVGRYPETKEAQRAAWLSSLGKIGTGGGWNSPSSPSQSDSPSLKGYTGESGENERIKYKDPFTGKVATMSGGVSQDYGYFGEPDEEGERSFVINLPDVADIKHKDFKEYVGDVRKKGFNVPESVKDVDELSKWYYDNYADKFLSRGQKVTSGLELPGKPRKTIKGLRNEFIDSHQDTVKVWDSDKDRYIDVPARKAVNVASYFRKSAADWLKQKKAGKNPVVNIKLGQSIVKKQYGPTQDIRSKIFEANTAQGSIFKSEEAARDFVGQVNKLGLLYDYQKAGNVWRVYKP